MGVMCHHAIVVTTTHGEYLERARQKALEVCKHSGVTEVVEGCVNDVRSFLVGPDGSLEGWEQSRIGEEERAELLAWLNRQRFEDGSSPYAWVLVEYGDRPGRKGAAVMSHAWTVNVGEHYKGPCDLETKRAPDLDEAQRKAIAAFEQCANGGVMSAYQRTVFGIAEATLESLMPLGYVRHDQSAGTWTLTRAGWEAAKCR